MFWGCGSITYSQCMIWQGIFHTYNLHHKYNFKENILILIGQLVLIDGVFPSVLLALIPISLKTLFEIEVSYWPPINFFHSSYPHIVLFFDSKINCRSNMFVFKRCELAEVASCSWIQEDTTHNLKLLVFLKVCNFYKWK